MKKTINPLSCVPGKSVPTTETSCTVSNVSKVIQKEYCMAVYQTEAVGPSVWLNGILSDNEEDALNTLLWSSDITEIRILRFTLPVLNTSPLA